jgi:hypothetical protein
MDKNINMEEMDFHDLSVSKINLDFVNEFLELEIQLIEGDTDEIISKKITFKNIREIKSIGFPSIHSICEINSFIQETGNELKYLIKLVILTGHGKMPWFYDFECSDIDWG